MLFLLGDGKQFQMKINWNSKNIDFEYNDLKNCMIELE